MHFLLRPLAFVTIASLATAVSNAQTVTYTDLYTLGPPVNAPQGSFLSIGTAGKEVTSGGESEGTGYGSYTNNQNNALLWNNNSAAIDLQPNSGFLSSTCLGVNGVYQVGSGYNTAASATHALLWSGTAASAYDLHPSGYSGSAANGVGGGQEVGYGTLSGAQHALVWTGASNVAVDLHPTAYTSSIAYGTDGSFQVGVGTISSSGHALLWNSTSASAIDLQPSSGYTGSLAYAVGGGEEVGYGALASGNHDAMLWSGSSASYIDLNPTGFVASEAYAVDGTQQVGYGRFSSNNKNHALYWTGSAGSYIDLQTSLPSNLTSSLAYSISGNTVFGIATDTNSVKHEVEWTITAAPEPTSLLTFVASGAVLLVRRRRA